MKGYRNSNGGMVRLASGGAQANNTAACCCGGTCANTTGCGGTHTLCTGLRFVLPHLDSVSISGSQTHDESTDPAYSPWPRFYNFGTYLSNGTNSVQPFWAYTYDIDVSAVDHEAFKSPYSEATYSGYKLTGTINGESFSFDGTAGTGVTFSSGITFITQPTGSWDMGPYVTGGGGSPTATETIESLDYALSEGTDVFEFEAIYYTIKRNYSGGEFSYTLDFIIERGRINPITYEQEYVVKREVTSSTPSYSYTQYNAYSAAAYASGSTSLVVQGRVTGTSSGATTPCAGTPKTFSVTNTFNRFLTGGGATDCYITPYDSGFTFSLPNPSSTVVPSDTAAATGTPAAGSVTMALDTGAWTDEEVGCRDCPRYLNISGTIGLDYAQSHYEPESVTATISGRIVMLAVGECGTYRCIWNSLPAPLTITYSDSTSSIASAILTRIGPSLWTLRIDALRGSSFLTSIFLLKFDGDCPTGSPEVCPYIRPTSFVVDGRGSAIARHRYGQRAVVEFDGSVTISDVDEWTDDGFGTYVDHTATTADLGTLEADLDDEFTSRVVTSSFTFSEDDREAGDPDYYCNGWSAFDTGDEVDGDSKDLHWRKKIGSGSYFAPTIETTNSFLPFYYNGDNSGAGKWIGTDADGTGEVDDHTYETYITWDGTPESDIHCFISADNYVTALEVNGVVVDTNLTPNDVTSHEQEFEVILYAADMVEGLNTIRFVHEDQSEREGFRCRFVRP